MGHDGKHTVSLVRRDTIHIKSLTACPPDSLDRPIDWPNERALTYWTIYRLISWWTDKLTDWWTNKLTDWWTNRLNDWRTAAVTDWLTNKLTDWRANWLTYWRTDAMTDRLTNKLTDGLIDWQTKWLTVRLTDWLPDRDGVSDRPYISHSDEELTLEMSALPFMVANLRYQLSW